MSTTRTPASRISVSTLAAILAMCLACAIATGVCAEETKGEAKEVLIQKLNSPHRKVRVLAAWELQDMADVRTAVPGLIRMLDDRTPLVWASEISSHGKNANEFGSTSSGEPSSSPAMEAAVALGHIGDHRATKPLTELFRNGVSYERTAALHALAMIEGYNSFNLLIEALKDKSDDIASEARDSMHDVMFESATKHPLDLTATRRALSLLEDRRADVRASAAEVLGNLHEPLAVPSLSELAHKSNHFDGVDAGTMALDRIQDFLHDPPLRWVSGILGIVGLLLAIFGIGVFIYRVVRRTDKFYDNIPVCVVLAMIGFFGYAGIRDFNYSRSVQEAFRKRDVVALVKNAYSCNESYPGDNRAAFILVEISNEKVIKVMGNDARGTDRHKRTVAQWVLARVIAENEGSKLEHMANSRDPEVKNTIAWLLKEMDNSRRR